MGAAYYVYRSLCVHAWFEYSRMIDKISLERTCQEIELDIPEITNEEKLELRENVAEAVEIYLTHLKATHPDDTLEQLTSARDALYQIYLTAGRGRKAVEGNTNPALKELVKEFDRFLAVLRAQAEVHFNSSN